MLRVATTVIVAALMAASLASAALANHPGHGGGQTTLSDLGCGPDKIARVNAADEWECNADLTANEAAAAAAQGTADGAASKASAKRIERWYAEQAKRLGVTREELDAAVLRGWPGNEISELPASHAHLLAGTPGASVIALERIKAAPILPVIATRSRWASGRSAYV